MSASICVNGPHIRLRSKNNGNVLPLIVILMSCDEHGGSHNFAVVEFGTCVIVSEESYQCLKDHGLEPTVEHDEGTL